MSDYKEDTSKLKGQQLAWRVGGMKFMLALLIKQFGPEKVKEELESVIKDFNLFKDLF